VVSAAHFFGHHRRLDNVLRNQRRGQEHGKEGLNLGYNADRSVLSFAAFLWFAAGTATATADYDFGLIGTVTPNEISSDAEESNFTL
jgi:hypothetical protein